MSSLFKSTKNTRALLPDSYKYIRSDAPYAITDDEIQWLIDNSVRTIVDLRNDDERAEKPCVLMNDLRFEYLCLPVSGGGTIPSSPDDVPFSYVNMLDSNMNKYIYTLLGCNTNVLYFCNAGKDRTGIVSAILLNRLGYDKEYIIEDYLKSAENLKEELEKFVEAHPEVDIRTITPRRENIEKIFKFIQGVK